MKSLCFSSHFIGIWITPRCDPVLMFIVIFSRISVYVVTLAIKNAIILSINIKINQTPQDKDEERTAIILLLLSFKY